MRVVAEPLDRPGFDAGPGIPHLDGATRAGVGIPFLVGAERGDVILRFGVHREPADDLPPTPSPRR